MKFQTSIVKLALVATAAIALTGCGNRTIAAAPIDEAASAAADSPTAPAAPVTTAAPLTTGTPAMMTAAAPAPTLVDLTASVTSKKNGSFLGMGTFKCTVEVSNSSSVVRSGTLTVTFMNGSKPSSTAPITKQVTIPAGGSQSFDLSDSKWSTSDVQVDVTTTPYQAPAATQQMMTAPIATTGAYGY